MKDEQKSKALQACRMIVDAYANRSASGAVYWDDMIGAYEAAKQAIRLSSSQNRTYKVKM